MKIAIVTLPLHTNYGGLLQAYALKLMLEDMGHVAVILDLKRKIWFPGPIKAPFMYAKRMLLKILKGAKGPEVFREFRLKREYPVVSSALVPFVEEYIRPRMIDSYSEIKEGEYDAFVVGSDQVWRPMCFENVTDAYLKFTADWDVRRISYAASFGTDELEYDYTMMEECGKLLSSFDGVSVREDSGVSICDQWLDCDRAVHVLDPVMMLEVGVYRGLASRSVSCQAQGKVLAYILDRSQSKSKVVDFVSGATGKGICDVSVYPKDGKIPLNERIVPPMEEWLAAFSQADFVVTDSFHGCVLSILFHKPFLVVGNRLRGMARIESLLRMFSLESRLVEGIDPDDDGEGWLMDIDWNHVDQVLEERRQISLQFLKDSL